MQMMWHLDIIKLGQTVLNICKKLVPDLMHTNTYFFSVLTVSCHASGKCVLGPLEFCLQAKVSTSHSVGLWFITNKLSETCFLTTKAYAME